jgi:hypothetical protein
VFRYACLLENGEPLDPAIFVVAEPRWHTGDTFLARDGREYKIVDIQLPPDQAEGVNGVWTVEPTPSR